MEGASRGGDEMVLGAEEVFLEGVSLDVKGDNV